jgi:hypothetical protein
LDTLAETATVPEELAFDDDGLAIERMPRIPHFTNLVFNGIAFCSSTMRLACTKGYSAIRPKRKRAA